MRDQIQAIEREIEQHERSIARLKVELSAALVAQREVEISGLADQTEAVSGKKLTIKSAIISALRRNSEGLSRQDLLGAVNVSRTAAKPGISKIKIDSLNTQLNKLEQEGRVETDDARDIWRAARAPT